MTSTAAVPPAGTVTDVTGAPPWLNDTVRVWRKNASAGKVFPVPIAFRFPSAYVFSEDDPFRIVRVRVCGPACDSPSASFEGSTLVVVFNALRLLAYE